MANLPESLSEKLRSLGVQTGPKDIHPKQKHQPGIEDIVDGQFIETSFGSVFCSETSTGSVYTHGNVEFIDSPIHDEFIQWAIPNRLSSDLELSSILFLDTETTGLSGGTGTIPFMIGVGRFTTEGFLTSQIFLRNPAEERAQLELLQRYFTGVKAIATYNGKAFDAPIIRTRYVLNSLSSPLHDLPHFDLLPLSRRLWKRRLENRGLKDIETEILDFRRSVLEVPGWEVPILYFNFLRTGDPAPMAGVFYHNAIDIQSLAALFLYMNQMASKTKDSIELAPIDTFSLAIQFETSGNIETAISMYEQLLSTELPEQYTTELQLRYARILKRKGDFTHIVDVLKIDRQQIDVRVMIQLAKVMEHQHRDNQTALEWTNMALKQLEINKSALSDSTYTHQMNELLKRRSRLIQKASKMGEV
jgi:uncharacterized protein